MAILAIRFAICPKNLRGIRKMKRYKVTVECTTLLYYEITAKNKETAEDMAMSGDVKHYSQEPNGSRVRDITII